MVSFTNPGVLGTPAQFRREYESPILAGREPGASAEVVALGEERSGRLSALVNGFILRRTNALLSQHLPPKAGQGLGVETWPGVLLRLLAKHTAPLCL